MWANVAPATRRLAAPAAARLRPIVRDFLDIGGYLGCRDLIRVNQQI
jgi:hypothetical protein